MPEIRNFMTSPDLGADERAAIEIKREFPWWIMGSNQSLDRMSIKLPLLESTGPWARLYFVCFRLGHSVLEGEIDQPASGTASHTRADYFWIWQCDDCWNPISWPIATGQPSCITRASPQRQLLLGFTDDWSEGTKYLSGMRNKA